MDEMIKKYYPYVYKIAYQFLHDENNAQDICQEVFLRYIKAEKRFENEEHQRNWILRVTVNCCNSFLKSGWNRHTAYINEDVSPFWDLLEGEQDQTEDADEFPEWWEKVPEKYRAVIRMYYYEDLSVKEIADRLGEKESTVKSRLSRGRQYMRQEFEKNREETMDRSAAGLQDLGRYLEEQKESLARLGYFKKCGFGKKPAVINIDFENGWTRGGSSFSCDAGEAVENARRICDAARGAGIHIPIIFFKTAFGEGGGVHPFAWDQKIPLNKLTRNRYWARIDSRMGLRDGERVMDAYGSNCFMNTPLNELLRQAGIDTLILNGFTLSGSIRHTAMTAKEYGYKMIIAKDAVAERIPQAALWNLFDLEMLYADIVDSREIIDYLKNL